MVICLGAISFDILCLLVSILILPEIIFKDRINSMKKKKAGNIIPTAKYICLVNISFGLFEAEISLLKFRQLICNYGEARTSLTLCIVLNIATHFWITDCFKMLLRE